MSIAEEDESEGDDDNGDEDVDDSDKEAMGGLVSALEGDNTAEGTNNGKGVDGVDGGDDVLSCAGSGSS